MDDFGKILRYYRKQRRLTQTELANAVGVAPAYVSQIESSLRMPSLKVAKKFADALKVELPVLLGNADEKPAPDRLSDSEKLELLRSLVRSVEYDLESRAPREEIEVHAGAAGIRIAATADEVVRAYAFGRDVPGDPAHYHVHAGTEAVYCAAGRISVHLEEEVRELSPGETLAFAASRPHALVGDDGSVAISTASPPPAADTLHRMSAGDLKDPSAAVSAEAS